MIKDDYILSIESSDNTCGVALSQRGNIIGEVNYYGKNLHDRLLAGMCKNLLTDFNLQFDNISAIAVSAGPGSFTGLRISAALAKGICFGGDIKLIAVPNLSAFAYSALVPAEKMNINKICVLIKSNNNSSYRQTFNCADFSSDEISLIANEEILENISDDIIYIGSAAYESKSTNVLVHFIKTKAEFIANFAEKMYLENNFVEPSEYEPMYIQNFTPKSSSKVLNI
jgi:tRNA threonylcarbamoyladenosine biosynthesis protein TsaB